MSDHRQPMSYHPRPSWGSVDVRAARDGSPRYRLRGMINGRLVTVGTYPTLEDALRRAEAQRRAMAARPKGLTVGRWGHAWIDSRDAAGLHRSVKDMRNVWSNYVTGSDLEDVLLKQLRPEHVRSWVHSVAQRTATRGRNSGEKLNPRTVRNALRLLSASLSDAVEAGKLGTNPALGVKVPKGKGNDLETWTYLREDEIASVLDRLRLDAARDGNDRTKRKRAAQRSAITVAVFSGLREGELWGLRWEDVRLDGDHPELTVRRSYAEPTKGKRVRHVPLLPPAVSVLREWREHGGVVRMSGLVWPADDGRCHRVGYDAGWGSLKRRSGVTRWCPFHSLRHTCATHLRLGTWGPPIALSDLQIWMGHASITTTERYAHYGPEALHGAARRLREAMEE